MRQKSSTAPTTVQTILYINCPPQTTDPGSWTKGVATLVEVMQQRLLLPHHRWETTTVGPHMEANQAPTNQPDNSVHHPPAETGTWMLQVLPHTTPPNTTQLSANVQNQIRLYDTSSLGAHHTRMKDGRQESPETQQSKTYCSQAREQPCLSTLSNEQEWPQGGGYSRVLKRRRKRTSGDGDV